MAHIVYRNRKKIFQMLAELWAWKALAFSLASGAIRSDKRNTILGNVWHLLNPIITMFIFLFVFKFLFNGRQPNYALFFFCGSLFFRYVTVSMTAGASCFQRDAALLKACAFPPLVLIAATVIQNIYYTLVEGVVLALLMIFYRVPLSPYFLLLPVLFAVVTAGVAGLTMLTACLGSRFPDFSSVLQHIVRVLFYFSPVMYPIAYVPEEYRSLYMLNPLAVMMESARDLVMRAAFDSGSLLYVAAVSAGLFAAGCFVFNRYERFICKGL